MQERFKLGYVGLPGRCTGRCVHLGWALPIFRFLQQLGGVNGSTCSTAANASAIVNAGQAARYVDNYLDCTASVVPAEADIIVVDGVNGMSPMVGNHVKPTEKVLRRLLSLPHQPAIVLLHWMDWCACARSCQPSASNVLRKDRHRNGSCYTAEGFRQSYEVSTRREQSSWASLARHYQFAVLSMRSAFHPLARAGQGTSNSSSDDDGLSGDGDGPASWTSDGLHPKMCLGSWQKCRYSLLIAALLNTFLADVHGGHHHWPLVGGGHDQPLPLSAMPLRSRASERTMPVERCFGWGVDRRVTPPIDRRVSTPARDGWRQTSMDTAHSFDPPAHCTGRRSQQSLPTCPKAKAGLTAFSPGSVVVFELPVSSSTTTTAPGRSWSASLTLGFLTSYEGMGMAVASCMRGCECEPTTVDAHRSALISVVERLSWPVRLHGDTCAVSVVLENRTRSGGTKFKVDSITLRWAY